MRSAKILRSVAQVMQKAPRNIPAKKFFRTTHCLFDLDGTILDTQRSYEQACAEVFRKYNARFTHEWHRKMLLLSAKDFWKHVHDSVRPSKPWLTLDKECEELYANYIEHKAPLKPGAQKLINHLHKHKVPMALVTSCAKEVMEWKTRNINHLITKFNHVVCADSDFSVKRFKPSPDVYLICAGRFLEKPVYGNCLVFEDTPRGIMAAVNAGMQCVAVPHQTVPLNLCHAATLIINSFMEFEPEVFGLPAFDDAEAGNLKSEERVHENFKQ